VAADDLRELGKICSVLTKGLPKAHLRQTCRRVEEKRLTWGGFRNPIAKQCAEVLEVPESEFERMQSIDQLYLQANLAHPIFISKVCEWARVSSGYFPHKTVANTFIAWPDAICNASIAANIKWASIKKPDRSFEKVYRSYSNDVSRLVDIVRQQIIFKTVRDVLGTPVYLSIYLYYYQSIHTHVCGNVCICVRV